MVKVSITLPNATQITLESEEPELIHEVVGLALRELPKELLQAGIDRESSPSSTSGLEKGTSVTSPAEISGPGATEALHESPSDSPNVAAAPAPAYSEGGSPRKSSTRSSQRASRGSGGNQEPTEPQGTVHSGESAEAFAQFCRGVNPVGDMRRVVVAAEGANRFLGMESVDSTALANLFELAGWRLPHNFTQTLRNAARGKFQWLERIPGRAGRYSVTPIGRSINFGE